MEEETLSALMGPSQERPKKLAMIKYIEKYGVNLDRETAIKIGRLVIDMGDSDMIHSLNVGCAVLLDELSPDTLVAVYDALHRFLKK